MGFSMPFFNHLQYTPWQVFSWKRPVVLTSDTKRLVGKRLFITVKVSYVTAPFASPVGYIS